jgi:hypothetical protein
MNRHWIAMLLAPALVAVGSAQARPPDGFGVGLILGEPTGLSLKKWVAPDRAIDAGIAWSFSENDSLHLHGDYLFHWFDRLEKPATQGRLPLYAGLGARFKFKEEGSGGRRNSGRNRRDAMIGVRVPFGISYLFADAPVDLFAEIVPILDVAPDTRFSLNAAIGARFYF